MSLVRACLASLPRLTAEENFLAMSRTAMGTGAMAKDDQKSILGRWSDQAAPPVPSVTPAATPSEKAARVARASRVFDTMARSHEKQHG